MYFGAEVNFDDLAEFGIEDLDAFGPCPVQLPGEEVPLLLAEGREKKRTLVDGDLFFGALFFFPVADVGGRSPAGVELDTGFLQTDSTRVADAGFFLVAQGSSIPGEEQGSDRVLQLSPPLHFSANGKLVVFVASGDTLFAAEAENSFANLLLILQPEVFIASVQLPTEIEGRQGGD